MQILEIFYINRAIPTEYLKKHDWKIYKRMEISHISIMLYGNQSQERSDYLRTLTRKRDQF
jgi:hypothetical protein